MSELDRMTARALVEAGYMPLSLYIELFGPDLCSGGHDVSIIPSIADDEFEPAEKIRYH